MGREARGSIVSVRLSEQEQVQLRQIAESRGTSISEVIRSYVAGEMHPTPLGQTASAQPTNPSVHIEGGVRWQAGTEAVADGTNLNMWS